MAFRLEDFKKTTRKGGEGAPASVYPHLLKDKKAGARLDIAIRTFDALVGKRRGEMDAQTMTDFFGDPRIARGIVACLGQFYQYKTPRLAELVGSDAARRLQTDALATPFALRAHTYRYVNASHDGFLTEEGRAACYEELARPFGMSAHEWDALLWLDREENQILTRPGAVPTPADIAALYNFHTLDTPLRRAVKIVVNGLNLSLSQASDVRALAHALGVRAVVASEGASVTLSDLEMSSLLPRRPGRLSRAFLSLVHAWGGRQTTGYADTMLGTRKFRLAIGWEMLKWLGVTNGAKEMTLMFKKRFAAADELGKAWAKRRAKGETDGWRLKRLPEPIVTPQGVLLPDFTTTRDAQTAHIVLGDAPTGDWNAPILTLPLGRKPLDPCEVLAKLDALTCNLFALPDAPAPPALPSDFLALCDRAARTGLVPAADATRALHLLDESPLIEWVRRAADPRIRYVPGIGLLSEKMVLAVQEA